MVNDEKKGKENLMKNIFIEKITLNVGAGKSEDLLKRGLVLLQKLSPLKPVKTVTKKRIPGWGLRPGLAIGCKVTVRDGCEDLLKRLLAAKRNTLPSSCFDSQGNFSFGIAEYIDIRGLDYDPDLKIMGLEVAVTLSRAGFSVSKRKVKPSTIGVNHKITADEAKSFVRGLGVEVQ